MFSTLAELFSCSHILFLTLLQTLPLRYGLQLAVSEFSPTSRPIDNQYVLSTTTGFAMFSTTKQVSQAATSTDSPDIDKPYVVNNLTYAEIGDNVTFTVSLGQIPLYITSAGIFTDKWRWINIDEWVAGARWWKELAEGETNVFVDFHVRSFADFSVKKIKLQLNGKYQEFSFETRLLVAPNLTLSPATNIEAAEGEMISVTWQVHGNPPPIVQLSRERTGEVLFLKDSGELEPVAIPVAHSLGPLTCLDTDVYVFSANNTGGADTSSLAVAVRCSQSLRQRVDSTPVVYGMLGESRRISIEVYGYPAPTGLRLIKILEGVAQTAPDKHQVTYTSLTPPFGVVELTMVDLVKADFTTYTVIVDNGVANGLEYVFDFVEVVSVDTATSSDDKDSTEIMVYVFGLVVIVALTVAVFGLALQYRKYKKLYSYQTTKDTESKQHDTMGGINSMGEENEGADNDTCTYLRPLSACSSNGSVNDQSGHPIDMVYVQPDPTSVSESNVKPYDTTCNGYMDPPNIYEELPEELQVAKNQDYVEPDAPLVLPESSGDYQNTLSGASALQGAN